MKWKRIKDKKWVDPMLVACVAVILYVVLTRLTTVLHLIGSFIGFFMPLILGCVVAYLINPLAKALYGGIFKKIEKENLRWSLSAILAVILMIVLIGFLLGTLIPQLIDSIKTFSGNLEGYLATLQELVDKWHISKYADVRKFLDSSENIWKQVIIYLTDNIGNIVDASADVGKTLVNWLLGIILSIYLLMSKQSVVGGVARLLKAVFSNKQYREVKTFLVRCDDILSHYITYSLIECMLIGVVNAVFMAIMGMQYIGMISVVVAITNLIPTFGPIIGGLIGAFILLLVNPWHALAFIIFTLVLQTVDGYVIKPKLFGNSLGVSGLLILITIIVGGKMFGVVGILLSIPFAAIIDFIYKDYILMSLEKHRKACDADEADTK